MTERSIGEETTAMGRERPSRHGAILGQFLAEMARAGGVKSADMCATCAFREGCMTNQMAATLLQAFNIVAGLDTDQFACHHGMEDGWPTKICGGYLAAMRASFETLKAAGAILNDRMSSMSGPDEIRAAFDAWIAEIDPDNQIDDYRRARLYERSPLRSASRLATEGEVG